jgi:hypothetical protein
MASFGGSEKSLVVGKGASCLALCAIISGVVGCSEGSTDPVPSAGAGGASGGGGAVGVSGSSGAAPTAGSGGNSGGSAGNVALRTFDFAEAGDTAEWLFVYAEPAGLIAPPAPVVGDAGADAGAPAPPPEGVATVEHDAQAGNPDNGSARLELPFDGANQKISFEVNVAMADVGVNLAARSISARIRVDSGLALDPMNPAGIKLYVKTGPDSVYADSGFLNLAAGTEWQTLVWPNVTTATFVDTARGAHAPTDVRQVGIEFATGAMGTYAPAVVHVDTVVF